MQRRLPRKRHLEIFLTKIKPHAVPVAELEQYTIPVDVAAGILYMAAYTYDDIVDKRVADLGCGTGRLALGAAWLGAKEVVGIDIDRKAVKQAKRHAEEHGFSKQIQWIVGDLDALHGNFDTVLQNPPFGVQKRQADRRFLRKAIEIGRRVYSLHKSAEKNMFKDAAAFGRSQFVAGSPSAFMTRFIDDSGGRIEAVYSTVMTIPHLFRFHRKPLHSFMVDLYVIENKRV